VKSHLAMWIKAYANWAAAVLFVAALFTSLVANSFVVPLVLFALTIALVSYGNWTAIRTFDIWAFDEWFRTRLDAIGTRDWQAPYQAAETYCSVPVVMARNEAAASMNTIMMELVKDGGSPLNSSTLPTRRHADYDTAQVRFNHCNSVLGRELVAYLAQGHLIAKGLLVQDDIAKSERIIPTSRWRVLSLDLAKADASGQGWHYTGVVIGKRPAKPQPQKAPPGQQTKSQLQQTLRPQASRPSVEASVGRYSAPPVRPPQKSK
jgi:hypothetical protein